MPLITISENLGSGGMSIARQAAEKFNINLYDDERLQKESEIAEKLIRKSDHEPADLSNFTFTWI
jgi:hypothetical protein